MTLQEMLAAVDELSWDEIEELQERIDQRRKHQHQTPAADEELRRQLAEIFKDAEPVVLVPGTMNVEKLMQGIDAMREGLTQEELNAIADAMNEEFVEMDDSGDE